jgi:hypothetical protein
VSAGASTQVAGLRPNRVYSVALLRPHVGALWYPSGFGRALLRAKVAGVEAIRHSFIPYVACFPPKTLARRLKDVTDEHLHWLGHYRNAPYETPYAEWVAVTTASLFGDWVDIDLPALGRP